MVGHRKMLTLTAAGCLLLVSAAPAQAATGPATASAASGAVAAELDGQQVSLEPLAPCVLGQTPEAAVEGAAVDGVVSYGPSSTTCVLEEGEAVARAEGQTFETSVLARYGGPTVKVRNYSAECRTTGTGSSTSMTLSGVTGFDMPAGLPVNQKISIPAPDQGAAPLAEITVNEIVAPEQPDGSVVTHALRMELFPGGGPASGEIVLGTAACDPVVG